MLCYLIGFSPTRLCFGGSGVELHLQTALFPGPPPSTNSSSSTAASPAWRLAARLLISKHNFEKHITHSAVAVVAGAWSRRPPNVSVPAVMQSVEGEPEIGRGCVCGGGATVRTGSWTSCKPPPARGLCVKSGRSSGGPPEAETAFPGTAARDTCPGGSHASPGSPRPGAPSPSAPRRPERRTWLGGGGVGGERCSRSGPPPCARLPAAGERLSAPRPGRYRRGKLSNSTGLFREAAFPLPRCAPVQSRHRGSSNPPRAAAGQEVSSGKAKAPPSLRPCSKCWPGSGGASPGLCTRGARSPR